MAEKLICFDLDGTLLDISDKYYLVHKKCSEECGLVPLDQDTYWQLKRLRVAEEEIVSLKNTPNIAAYKRYITLWSKEIETKKILESDRVVKDCFEVLEYLKNSGFDIRLATLRKNRTNTLWEIEKLELKRFFDKIAISNSTEKTSSRGKTALIKKISLFNRLIDKKHKKVFIVGDTEVDLLSAQYLGVPGIAVTYGIRDKNILKFFSPYLIEKISEILNLLS